MAGYTKKCMGESVKIEINCANNAFEMLFLVDGKVILGSIDIYWWYKTSGERREDRNDEKDAGRSAVSWGW